MNEHTEDPCRFPPLEPWDQGLLDVGDGHALHYEQCGAAHGLPLLFLHGGPGSGCSPRHRRLFDPAGYRILLFDQRGCGRSTPRGGLRHNTTAHLVADIERLRVHLGIDRWLVCGGSWGASLALAYCAAHKPACLGLVLRGVFLTGRRDLAWFFDEARQLLPEEFDAFAAPAPKRRRRDLLGWYRRTLEGGDPQAALAAVRAWMRWEEALGQPGRRPSSATEAAIEAAAEPGAEEAERLLAKYRLQAHYLSRRCFLGEAHLLDCAARLHGLPTAILHGRLDLVCRPQNAWRVHQTAHGSRLLLVDGAGHSPFDPPMAAALAGVTGHFLRQRDFAGWGRSVHERA
jgi:proline iminopeptidase